MAITYFFTKVLNCSLPFQIVALRFFLFSLLLLIPWNLLYARSNTPTVSTPTLLPSPFQAIRYPWKKNITATVFWIGEKPTSSNPTPNHKSAWDQSWQKNYGGYDDPDPRARKDYRPKSFIPRLNPFYIALPYNDVFDYRKNPKRVAQIIPWWNRRVDKHPMRTSCQGRWVAIVYKNRICYAQWEDVGPFEVDDWQYVFGNHRPRNTKNNHAGIDISPAVRDYLKMGSQGKVHWRFVDFAKVPKGPWAMYGNNNPFLHPKLDPDLSAKQAYARYLRQLRDEAYRAKHSRP